MHYHLFNDTPFIKDFFSSLLKFDDPRNHCIIINQQFLSANKFKHLDIENPPCKLIILDYYNPFQLFRIVNSIKDDDKLYIHYLDNFKALFVKLARKKNRINIYWNYFGGYLYVRLSREGKLDLLDAKTSVPLAPLTKVKKNPQQGLIIRIYRKMVRDLFFKDQAAKIIPHIQYMSFWNRHDYSLVTSHLGFKGEFVYFRYFAGAALINTMSNDFVTQHGTILLNHSGSLTGNHLDILPLLADIGLNESTYKVNIPLSYGSPANINRIRESAQQLLPISSNLLLDFMAKSDYYQLLRQCSVGIFGHKRQEAANNIFYLLSAGSKIFLRKESTMYNYLVERGYHVYCLETDLLSIDDLIGLSTEKQNHNWNLVQQEFSEEAIAEVFHNFINH